MSYGVDFTITLTCGLTSRSLRVESDQLAGAARERECVMPLGPSGREASVFQGASRKRRVSERPRQKSLGSPASPQSARFPFLGRVN